jgi:outer membrane protein assembly factor BamA
VLLNQRVFWNTGPDIFVGPQLKVLSVSNVSFDNSEGNQVPLPDVEGNEGGTDIGFGVGATWDKRNSILTPTENFFLELSTHFYAKALGSSRSFNTIKFDARKYFDLTDDQRNVFAVQTLMNFSIGNTPFYEMGRIGGKSILRGYLYGRFRDNHAIQIQGEFRRNLIGRFGFTVFGALGNVADRFDNFQFNKTKVGGGAGLRFNINRKDTANVRIDWGWTPESNGLYITFGEAF